MATITLESIEPPHAPEDQQKLASLIEAYNAGKSVTPIVVIDWTNSELAADITNTAQAITGSHRLAAMLEVYNPDNDIELHDDQIIVIDGDQLLRDLGDLADGDDVHQAINASQALDELDRFARGRSVDLGELCHLLLLTGVLPKEAAEALADQT